MTKGLNLMLNKLKAYRFPIILIISIMIGAIIGLIFGEKATIIKPFGDVFINLLFMVVLPLVFFSISSAIANMDSMARLGKIMGSMMTIFVITGIISSIFMLISSVIFKPGSEANIPLETPDDVESLSLGEQLVNTFTVPDFIELFSGENMMALIVFSVLIGLSTGLAGNKGKPFATFLNSGSEVLMKLVQLVMYYAPIGLGAYFASLIGEFGSDLIGDYVRAIIMYYPVALLYFFVGFILYVFFFVGKFLVSLIFNIIFFSYNNICILLIINLRLRMINHHVLSICLTLFCFCIYFICFFSWWKIRSYSFLEKHSSSCCNFTWNWQQYRIDPC